ncbi:hypothetical protein [Hwangdonia seohaensis]|uniref:Uncharacterized protein n=1 Tax=Hwangdonia seohaensis TaxID=1240727 RepID=A0ABW3RB23_9FLAO|nr:hypothetical protein [Hwangdonia seohaensis]
MLISKDIAPINKKTATLIVFTPIVATLFIVLTLAVPPFRTFGFSLLKENNVVELLTFATFLIGGIFGLINTFKHSKYLGIGFSTFYGIFSFFLILIAMEEIAWGQWFFGFKTPENWIEINAQKETTLHNLKGMQGNTEFLRLAFGVGGLIGILLNKYSILKKINVHSILAIWFIIITLHAIVDIYSDFIELDKTLDLFLTLSSEFIELLIAGSAFLYLWINKKRILQN